MKGDDIIILVLLVFICIISLINYIFNQKKIKDIQKKYLDCFEKLIKMQQSRNSQIAKEIMKLSLSLKATKDWIDVLMDNVLIEIRSYIEKKDKS